MSKAFLDCSCSVVPVYDFAYDDDHVLHVVEAGTTDLDAVIQTFSDTCGMDFVMKCVSSGDFSPLSAKVGSFGDFTDAPQSLAQVQAQQAAADAAFSTLPADIKNGRSANDVINLTAEQLDAYIKNAVEAQLKASNTTEVINNE